MFNDYIKRVLRTLIREYRLTIGLHEVVGLRDEGDLRGELNRLVEEANREAAFYFKMRLFLMQSSSMSSRYQRRVEVVGVRAEDLVDYQSSVEHTMDTLVKEFAFESVGDDDLIVYKEAIKGLLAVPERFMPARPIAHSDEWVTPAVPFEPIHFD